MEEVYRKAQPDCMRYIIEYFLSIKCESSASATIDRLIRLLMEKAHFAKPAATDNIYNAIQDGLLMPVISSPHGVSPRVRLNESRAVRLPDISELEESDHDFYCFECHLPGMLEFCTQCPRSFHRLCYRKNADRPNYTVPSAKLQKNRLPVFTSEEETSDEECFGRDLTTPVQALKQLPSVPATSHDPAEHAVDSTSSPTSALNSASMYVEGKPPVPMNHDYNTVQYDTKTKLEVLCIGEVRPPNRQRFTAAATNASNISYKNEVSHSDDVDMEHHCTCCRLLKGANVKNPPNLDPDEICYLINYTFSYNRTWLATDARSYIEMLKLSDEEREAITKLLFKIPPQSLDDIADKLQNNKYRFLMEFLVDALDIQHHMGVLFGPYSTEMESTKWFIRDIMHDLSEIRRCPDCFRYSSEKCSDIWFAKPCVQRHELVFAKHNGYSYWPAKVIRVLPNNKYDVRFFGGSHSRALINVEYIKPIDSDDRTLKLVNTPAFKKAIEELRYHQVLLSYPPSKFSFHADKKETENIIREVMGRGILGKTSLGRKRMVIATPASVEESSENPIQGSYEGDSRLFSPLGKRKKFEESSARTKRMTRSSIAVQNLPDLKKINEDLEKALKVADNSIKKNDKLCDQITKLKETIKKHEIEKKIIKRKQWCYWCLNEAIYLCCFKAAYCSQVCQSRHWKDGHSNVCKNEAHQTELSKATSTT